MKLLVIVLCLLSERFLIHSISYQRFFWFNDYYLFLKKTIDRNQYFANPWLELAATVLPIILLVSLIYFSFESIFFGLFGLVFNLFVFYYCLGPQNAFYPIIVKSNDQSEVDSIGEYFAEVNSQLFAVIFWYIIAGPIAVLTYRLTTLCKGLNSINPQAIQVAEILEWIPARITALLFLLVGNFQRGFNLFIHYAFAHPNLNDEILSECGLQAVRINDTDEVPMVVAENLVEHATIVLLVFIALFTLVAWL
ncbi:membrane protein [Legionella norrlandica]|uniref:Membrane protein n=1 Tax=Legionella norrlandica TaxID=1498499 RepID=A0A0A2SUH3_9GAMM|nr:membrane protein [Legionella norrlandica]KGP64377.1 membrane protein [Legionella norrlandica]